MGHRFSSGIRGRVSRRSVALSPQVWGSVGLLFAAFGITCIGVGLLVPGFRGPNGVITGAALVAIAALLLSRPTPEEDSVLPQVALAGIYVGTSAAMFAFAPHSSIALPAAAFVGVFAAVWLDSARQIIAHYVAASTALLLPSVLGVADLTTFIAACTVVPPSFVLGLAARSVLGLAERQGQRLEDLAMRDPLTGAGNRRLLDEQLDIELERAQATRRPLTVYALDLNGFKQINDTLGHAAGDRVLRDVAGRLIDLAGDRATVSRLGGDEFVVVSPNTGRRRAEELADELIAGLGPAISAGIGWATWPHDGDAAQPLLETADARLIARKAANRDDEPSAAWVDELVLPEPASVGPAHESGVRAPRRPLTRDVLGAARVIWRITGVMFLFFAAVAALFVGWAPQFSGQLCPPLILFGVAIGVTILCSKSPALHTWGSELTLALTYLVPTMAMLVTSPTGSAVIGFGIFVGPLVAVRTRTRTRAAVHIAANVVVMGAVAASGLVDTATVLAIGMLCFTTMVLALYCVVVLELVEAEGDELERLSALDPLTLLANRRRLAERLAELTEVAASGSEPLAVIAMDLNGFKHLNDTVGHGAGDLLLIEVADRLRAACPEGGLAARPGGDEFTLIVPGHDHAAAARLGERLRALIGSLRPSGCPISTGVGIATFPGDADAPGTLLAAADARLIADKYGREPAPVPA